MKQTLDLPFDVRLMGWVANTLFMGFVALGLGSAFLWAANHPVWTVRGITVVGDVEHQNAVAFRAQIASRLQGSFLTLNLQEVQQLFEAVPWVRQAVVQRTFPNRLTVTLQEQQAVAWWGEAGGDQLVNAQGEVFEASPDDTESSRWSELVGPDGQSQQVYALFQLLQPVFASVNRTVERLELNNRGNWRLRLDSGTQVDMGRGTQAELLARVHSYIATASQIKQRYGARGIETVDLRYPNGYAVRLQGVTTTADKPKGTAPQPLKPTH